MARLTRSVVSSLALLAAAHGARADEKAHIVKASSFADPVDVVAFKKCLKSGRSEVQCFALGDNGIGLWGDDTTVATPICALPRKSVVSNGRAIRRAGQKDRAIVQR